MNDVKLYYGKEITRSSSDVLVPVSLNELYQKIVKPDGSFMQLFERLKEVKQIDKAAFDRIKTRLPYFIGARFSENLRKLENYIAVDYFILDIDHFKSDDRSIEDLKTQLSADRRVALIYCSPGGEGLKLVFRFFENELTPSEYSNFYKAFAGEFARYYNLEKYLDFSTHDVSRVSFLSYDPLAVINENSLEVNPYDFISQYDLFKILEKDESPAKEEESRELNEDIYRNILKILNPKSPVRKNDVIVPIALESIPDPLRKGLDAFGIEMVEVVNIQYGKKFRIRHNEDMAEINIFYGKKGFSIVNCPVRGYSPQLSEVVTRIAENTLFEIKDKKLHTEPDFVKGNASSIGGGISLN